MVLNNFKLLRGYAENETFDNGSLSSTLIKDMSGSLIGFSTGSTNFRNTINNRIFKKIIEPVFGSGNTAPAATDYSLENDFTASLSSLTINRNYEVTNDNDEPKVTNTLEITGHNNTANDLMIREFGICSEIYSGNTTHSKVLLVREVLDTPITLEAGKGFALTITWEEG